jgi:hypothetical protein
MSDVLDRPRAKADLAIQPLTPITGAEVSGVDLRGELDPPTVKAIRDALLKHKVLVFRDQPISDAQQVRFSRYFGRVTPAHPITNGLPEQPEIKRNVLSTGSEYVAFDVSVDHPLRRAGSPKLRAGWHIDITFVANPNSITFLRGVEIPPVGGDTLFANLEALYEGLHPPCAAISTRCRPFTPVTTPPSAAPLRRASMAVSPGPSPHCIRWCGCTRRRAASTSSWPAASSRRSMACAPAKATRCWPISTTNSPPAPICRRAFAGNGTRWWSGTTGRWRMQAPSTASSSKASGSFTAPRSKATCQRAPTASSRARWLANSSTPSTSDRNGEDAVLARAFVVGAQSIGLVGMKSRCALTIAQESRSARSLRSSVSPDHTEPGPVRRHLLPPSDGDRYRQLTLTLGTSGDLTLTSHEMGASLEAVWGADDSETTLHLRGEAVVRLAFVLLCERVQGQRDGLERLAALCEQHGIEAELACWT